MAPVGIRCPGALRQAAGRPARDQGSPARDLRGRGRKGDEGADRNQRRRLHRRARPGRRRERRRTARSTRRAFARIATVRRRQGDWWRLITAAFLHYGPFHLILNMLGLYWFGSLLEQRIGSGRFLLIYLVSGLAGSAGALLLAPRAPTVGRVGRDLRDSRRRARPRAAARLRLRRERAGRDRHQPRAHVRDAASISIGGHIGGLIGGAVCALGLTRFGRGNAAYGRLGLLGIATIVLVGVVSIAVAYWTAKGYA